MCSRASSRLGAKAARPFLAQSGEPDLGMSSQVDISGLTSSERLALIDELWESLSDEEALPISSALGRELDRRVADAHRDPEEGRPWEEIRSDLEKDRG